MGSRREVNGLQDKGQSCWEKRSEEREREKQRRETEVVAKEERDGVKKHGQDRQGVIVKGKESANKCELEIERVKQKLCVCTGCVCVCVQERRQWSYSALSQQHRDYLAKFPLTNNNSPQVPIEARLCQDGDPPSPI